jgi:aquaporin Z
MDSINVLAEFFGTFLLLISILATGNAFVIGGTLALVILLIGGVSGGHVNPAVSLAIFLKSGISAGELGLYVAAQLGGATAAYYVYNALM